MISDVRNIDCMVGMKEFPDKFFDLAIVDVPYGIGEATEQMYTRHPSQRKYKAKDWDTSYPQNDYFHELMRVSNNQIIWGANHFISAIPFDSSCWLFWDKDGFGDFADGELAWTSFNTAVRKFKYTWNGFRKQMPEDRIHPTQKPIQLYKWLLANYAACGGKILDTHLGSGSSRIAAHQMGFDFYGFEIDKDYFDAAEKRFQNAIKQQSLFSYD